jgi:RHS repeat-associated protein
MIQGSNVYRFVTDQLGSVRLVVNVNGSTASGSVVQRIDYDAWGNVTNTPTSFDQPFGFAGGLWDRDTGLVHFGAREYDPVTGRWLQKDPIRFRGGDTNLYAYVGGDPVNRIDPSGLYPLGGFPLEHGMSTGGAKGFLFSGGGIAWGAGAQGSVGVLVENEQARKFASGSTCIGAASGVARGASLQFLEVWDVNGFFGVGHELGFTFGPLNGGILIANGGGPVGYYVGFSAIWSGIEVHKGTGYTHEFL